MAEVTQQITDQVLARLSSGNYILIVGAVQAANIKNWGDLPEGAVYGGVALAASDTDGTGKRITAEAIASYVQNAVNAHLPYVDAQTKTVWQWDADAGAYADSGISVVGPPGATGATGATGPQGVSGVAVAAEGQYAFNVDENGHLLVYYTGDAAPAFSLSEDGHLILEISDD